MSNEVKIHVTVANDTAAEREKIAAEFKAMPPAKIPITVDSNAAADAGRKAGTQGGNAMVYAWSAAAALGGPLVGAAMVGIGVAGLTALGATLVRGNPQVQAGWEKLAHDAKSAATEAASQMVVPIAGALGQIDTLVVQQKPLLDSAFGGAAQSIQPLTQGFVNLATNALPGFADAMQHSVPIANGLATILGRTGEVVSQLGHAVADNSGRIGSDLNQIGDTLKLVGSAVSSLIGVTTSLAGGALPVLNGALTATTLVLRGVDTLIQGLGPLGPILGGVALAGVAGFKLLPPVFNLAKTASDGLVSGITNFAGALEGSSPKAASMALNLGSLVERMGPAGLIGVAGAAAIVLGVVGAAQARDAQLAQDHAQSVNTLSDALRQSNGVINENVRQTVAADIQSKDYYASFKEAGISLKDLTDVALGVPGAFEKVTEEINKYSAANGVSSKEGRAAGNAMLDQGLKSNKLSADLQTLRTDMGDAVQKNKDLTEASQGSATAIASMGSATANAAVAASSGLNTYTQSLVSVASGALGMQAQFQQLDDAVTSARQGVAQAEQGVSNAAHGLEQASLGISSAQHGIEQAAQGVSSALHSEEQAVIATGQAQQGYVNAVYQETQAQQSVTIARQAAQQALISLQLQAESAATATLSAGVNLFDATKAAGLLGVNQGNVQAVAHETVTVGNEGQVKAAITLIQAEDQVASSANSSSQAQESLNTARKQGVDGNPAVVSAEHSLAQAQDAVTTAAQGVTNAQYQERQSHLAVSNAVYGEQQAQQALTNAKYAARQASLQLTAAHYQEQQAQKTLSQAKDADSHSTDTNTAAGVRNFQAIEQQWQADLKLGLSLPQTIRLMEDQGNAAGFTNQQVDNVIGSLTGLNGKTSTFYIGGVPSVDFGILIHDAAAQGIDPASLNFAGLPGRHRLQASGGPGGGLTLVGEQGPELVRMPVGAQVYPNSSVQIGQANGDIPAFATGGIAGGSTLVSANSRFAAVGAMEQALKDVLTVLGYKNLPDQPTSPPPAPLGGFNGGGQIAYNGPGGVAQWAPQILQVLGMLGQSPSWLGTIERRMNQESGGNPVVVNRWDSNWAKGTPSVGLMQVIGPTFRSNAGPFGNTGPFEYGVSVDPVANIYAGTNYAIHRYGSIAGMNRAGGYANGGPASGLIRVGENGAELVRVPTGSSVVPAANAVGHDGASAGAVSVNVSMTFSGDTDSVMATAVMRLFREGRIQLNANGQRVSVG